jgi:hypothetical protein
MRFFLQTNEIQDHLLSVKEGSVTMRPFLAANKGGTATGMRDENARHDTAPDGKG